MAGFVNINFSESTFKDLFSALGSENKARRAAMRAINDTARTARKNIVNRIEAVVNMTSTGIRKSVTVQFAKYNYLIAVIRISALPVALKHYRGTRQTNAGVTVKVFQRAKAQGGKVNARGFVARLPIEEMYGETVLAIFGARATTALAQEELKAVEANLWKNLNRQLDLFVSGAKGTEEIVNG
jgi:hypothetical protein